MVIELVPEEKEPGKYEMDFNASEFSSGISFYKIETENIVEFKKMMLMK